MEPAARAAALIRLLLGREPSAAEAARLGQAEFDCDTFLIGLLCGEDTAARYGDMTQHFIGHLQAEAARDVLPHKLAHDLALVREDLGQLQSRLDGLSGRLLELLRQEDRIAALFDSVREMQADVNAVRTRIETLETRMMLPAEAEHGV
jgi:hypothetical protein